MKVIGMDCDTDLELDWLWQNEKLQDKEFIDKAKRQNFFIVKRDEWMAETIDKEVIKKGAKGIVLVGYHHSFSHYAQPKINDQGQLVWEWPRMTNILYQKCKEKIFQICLHISENPVAEFIKANTGKEYQGGKPIIMALIEEIMAKGGNKPEEFDVFSSSFANLRDSKSFYFHFQPSVKLSDICRGYIFLKPFKKLSGCTWTENFMTQEMLEKKRFYYETVNNRKFSSAKELNEFFKGSR